MSPIARILSGTVIAVMLGSATLGITARAQTTAARGILISVLSGRADMVTGGDALVQVVAPAGRIITVNGRDVSAAFQPGSAANTSVALVDGLIVGRNTVRVQAGSASAQRRRTRSANAEIA